MTHPSDPSTQPDGDWGDFDDWTTEQAPAGDARDRSASAGPHGFAGLEDDPRVQAGVEHLQRAAREVIAASRSLLDVAEELVESPGGVTRVFTMLGDLGDLAQRAVRQSEPRSDDGSDPDPPVQRIPVS